MNQAQEQPQTERARHRYISKRIVVTGQLELTRPAHFGNGDDDDLTDMPLLIDEPLLADDEDSIEENAGKRAVITGASLAGALRNYLRERELGYEVVSPPLDPQKPDIADWRAAENALLAAQLFGGYRGTPDGDQSPLIIDDAFSVTRGLPEVELRDGVKLTAKTRTAEEKKKYDYQLLAAGTKFNLRFELLLDDDQQKNERRLKALAIALRGLGGRKLGNGQFEDGEIRLGARKRRGFGCCRVMNWEVTTYDLTKPNDHFAWLAADYQDKDGWKPEHTPKAIAEDDIFALLNVAPSEGNLDCREDFEIEADFEIDGSVMIRSGFDDQYSGPDTVHLKTKPHTGKGAMSVLSGTSIAGAVRQRALRIANTLAANHDAREFIDDLFGPENIGAGDTPFASRVLINEEFINDGQSLVQTRIKIDRFTGGTIESALLEEAPHFGGKVKLRMSLRNPEDDEVGLLLLVLKDLWLGDLPLGGESSIGRGRLRGVKSVIRRKRQSKTETIEMTEDAQTGRIKLSDEKMASELEECVSALNRKLMEAA